MKFKFVITSVFSIVSLVGIASAQQVQVFSGNLNDTVLVALTQVSATSGPVSGPNISSFAGQTVRIRIEAADASTASLMWVAPLSPSVCSPTAPFSPLVSGTYGRGVFTISLDTGDVLASTDPTWKGTCRILSVRLGDRSQHIGRIFFK